MSHRQQPDAGVPDDRVPNTPDYEARRGRWPTADELRAWIHEVDADLDLQWDGTPAIFAGDARLVVRSSPADRGGTSESETQR